MADCLTAGGRCTEEARVATTQEASPGRVVGARLLRWCRG